MYFIYNIPQCLRDVYALFMAAAIIAIEIAVT